MNIDEQKHFLTVTEAAAYYRVSRETVYKLIQTNRIPYEDVSAGKVPRYRIPINAVIKKQRRAKKFPKPAEEFI